MYVAKLYRSASSGEERLVCNVYDTTRDEPQRIAVVGGNNIEELVDGCMADESLRSILPDSVETIKGITNLKKGEGHHRNETQVPLEIPQLLEFNSLYAERMR